MTRTDLAKKLREIARHLDNPDHHHPTDLAARAGLDMLEAAVVVFLDGDQALARCQDWGGRGYSSGSSVEGHGKGGHSDPTFGAAALPDRYTRNDGDPSNPDNVPMGKRPPDAFAQRGDELRAQLAEASGLTRTAAREVRTLMATTPPLTESDRARCAQVEPGGCDEYAVDGRNCSPCRMWLSRHPEAQHVPKTVIEARRHAKRLAS